MLYRQRYETTTLEENKPIEYKHHQLQKQYAGVKTKTIRKNIRFAYMEATEERIHGNYLRNTMFVLDVVREKHSLTAPELQTILFMYEYASCNTYFIAKNTHRSFSTTYKILHSLVKKGFVHVLKPRADLSPANYKQLAAIIKSRTREDFIVLHIRRKFALNKLGRFICTQTYKLNESEQWMPKDDR